jgi:hypothetical protein
MWFWPTHSGNTPAAEAVVTSVKIGSLFMIYLLKKIVIEKEEI